MNRKLCIFLSFVLLLSFALSACQTTVFPGETQESETSAPDLTEGETSSQTDLETEWKTEEATEIETEPPVEVVIPEAALPNIQPLLKGESAVIDENHSMKNASLSALKTGGTFVSTGGSLFKESADGLTAVNTGWDALGFADPVSTDTYTAEVEFVVHKNDRGGDFNAAMVGLFCKTAANLFIDGGLWFSFRESQVSIQVKQGFQTVLDKALPFDAADGIRFKAVGDREMVTVYANDVLIATVKIASDGITVLNAKGEEAAAADLTNLSVSGNGYFRYMTHYANSTFVSMKLTGETQREYTPSDSVYAFMSDTAYAFEDKAQYLAGTPSTVYSELLFADGVMLGEMFGFTCALEGDTLTMTRDSAELVFTANTTEMKVNDEAFAFPTVIKKGESLLLAVKQFGEMMGYAHKDKNALTVLTTTQNFSQEVIRMAQERFDLYRDVVYNYDDVECDRTGVGRYDPTPYEERLVGIAYTTWHRSATKWGGTSTWDLPLYGTYCSDDEEVIRRHGEQLRDAGVDFVFVDWSNNTEYDPATMREQRDDFRMIEEATDKLFDIWATIEGAPKICIFVGPGHNGPKTIESGAHQKKVDQVWNDYVTNPERADMYFHYDGKPLLICYGATPNQYTATPERLWDDDRYTVRWMTGYVGQQSNLFRSGDLESARFWSWEERGAQTYTVKNGMVEAVTVSAATRSQGAESATGYIPEAGRQNGATLKKQFQRACDLGARIVLIVSWNEWSTGEQPSAEVSKDMEPSVIHGTFYLDLMREQIKKFKGQIQK